MCKLRCLKVKSYGVCLDTLYPRLGSTLVCSSINFSVVGWIHVSVMYMRCHKISTVWCASLDSLQWNHMQYGVCLDTLCPRLGSTLVCSSVDFSVVGWLHVSVMFKLCVLSSTRYPDPCLNAIRPAIHTICTYMFNIWQYVYKYSYTCCLLLKHNTESHRLVASTCVHKHEKCCSHTL